MIPLRRRQSRSRWFRAAAAVLLAAALLAAAHPARAEDETTTDEKVGVQEKLGANLPEGLVFNDEDGKPVELAQLIQRPTILTLVYFKCPSICGPLLNELAHTVDEVSNIRPGEQFDLITVSFDETETPDMAKTGKANLLGRMQRQVPERAWRFLTGEKEQIRRLSDAVGFRFKRSEDGADFVHAGTVIFLTKEGKIVRYLSGLEMLPFDLEMAVNDAAEGTPRTLMQRIQRLCFKSSPDGKGYTLAVNRIVLIVTLLGAAIFGLVLFLKRRRSPAGTGTPPPQNPSVAPEAMEGGAS